MVETSTVKRLHPWDLNCIKLDVDFNKYHILCIFVKIFMNNFFILQKTKIKVK